jgi:hypothetical protein
VWNTSLSEKNVWGIVEKNQWNNNLRQF